MEGEDAANADAEMGQEGENVVEIDAPEEGHVGGHAVPKEDRITTPYMTKYERARILGTRALQIRCASARTPRAHRCRRCHPRECATTQPSQAHASRACDLCALHTGAHTGGAAAACERDPPLPLAA